MYDGNPKLRSANTPIEWTQEKIEEWFKCKNDPLYFISTYCKLIHPDRGLIPFIPYPYQEKVIDIVENNRFVIIKMPRQCGKCLTSINTVRLRNKTTGEVKEVTIGEFFAKCKSNMSKM